MIPWQYQLSKYAATQIATNRHVFGRGVPPWHRAPMHSRWAPLWRYGILSIPPPLGVLLLPPRLGIRIILYTINFIIANLIHIIQILVFRALVILFLLANDAACKITLACKIWRIFVTMGSRYGQNTFNTKIK